jgi:hypothetical protein
LPNADKPKKEYRLQSSITGEICVFESIKDFANANGLQPGSVSNVLNKKFEHTHEWTLPGVVVTPKILYRFKSPDGTIYETDTITEFCRQHDLNKGTMNAIWNGIGATHKGWTKAEEISNV